jgi:hypothetical protein
VRWSAVVIAKAMAKVLIDPKTKLEKEECYEKT